MILSCFTASDIAGVIQGGLIQSAVIQRSGAGGPPRLFSTIFRSVIIYVALWVTITQMSIDAAAAMIAYFKI